MGENIKEVAVVTIDSFKVDALQEIQGKKEALQAVVAANPFVEITDAKTYDEAKKARTALKTARTSTTKEKDTLLSRIKEIILGGAKKVYEEDIVPIVQIPENTQQAEIDHWEDAKEKERQEKLKIEEDRKQAHRDDIQAYYNETRAAIDSLNYETAKDFKVKCKAEFESFEEFADQFESKVEMLKIYLVEKKKALQDAHNIAEQLRQIEEGKNEQKRIDGIKARIENWYNQWLNNIQNFMEFEDVERITNQFKESELPEIDGFTDLLLIKRNQLKIQLETRTSFLQQQEANRIAAENLAAQQNQLRLDQQALLIDKRKAQLTSLGFDSDGAYDQHGLKILVVEDDLVADTLDWKFFIDDTVAKIEYSKHPPIGVDIEVIEPESVGQPSDAFKEHFETIETLASQQEEAVTEPTREEIVALILNWTETADYGLLIDMAVRYGILTEKED